jgi:beta-lactamase regulating signal transducer with metallopeptidase domain
MERALIEYLVNALWQVPLLAAGAWLTLRLVKPSPQIQHGVWLAVLGLALLVPVYGMSTPAQLMSAAPPATAASQDPAQRQSFAFFAPTRSVRLGATTTRWLVRLYVATMVIGLFRIARAWRSARKLSENSQQTCLSHAHRAAFEDYGLRLRVKLPQLRESEEVSSPMIIGAVVPVLLLPTTFAGFPENEIRAALCHELAHVKRRDYLLNAVCELAALPLAWHPVMHEIQQRIRITREMVCDAMAAQEMESEIGYAKCLLALAHSMLGGRGMATQPHFQGLFSKNTLEERIMRLTETTTMSLRAKIVRAATGVAVMLAVGAMTAMLHVTPTMAQAKAGDPPPAADTTQPAVSMPASSTATSAVKHTTHGKSAGQRQYRGLTPAEQRRIQQHIADAQKQVAQATILLNSPEFEQRMDDARRKMAEATVTLNSPEFKQQMEDAQRRMSDEMLNSQQFKKQMADAQRQMAEATARLNTADFKRQMEDAQRQIDKTTEMLNSPEFKHQMDEVGQRIKEAFPQTETIPQP